MFRSVNIRDEVYKYLRTRIILGKYTPGHRFDLGKLENDLGISRTPLKEALQRLESDGFIRIEPRRGTFLAHIDQRQLLEIYEVRHAIERFTASQNLSAISGDQINAIRKVNHRMSQLLDSNQIENNLERYLDLDHKFHSLTVALSKNNQIIQIYKRLNVHFLLARVQQSYPFSQWIQAQQEHDRIFEAIEKKDCKLLVNAIDEHIHNGISRLNWVFEQVD